MTCLSWNATSRAGAPRSVDEKFKGRSGKGHINRALVVTRLSAILLIRYSRNLPFRFLSAFSDMLVATWFFAISTLPFLVYGVYAVAIEPANYIGYVYVVGSLFTFAGLGMWLVAGKHMEKEHIRITKYLLSRCTLPQAFVISLVSLCSLLAAAPAFSQHYRKTWRQTAAQGALFSTTACSASSGAVVGALLL